MPDKPRKRPEPANANPSPATVGDLMRRARRIQAMTQMTIRRLQTLRQEMESAQKRRAWDDG